MRPITFTYAPTATDADALCLAQQVASGAAMLLNGVLANSAGTLCTMGDQQVITVTTTQDNTLVTATITGKDRQGNTASESKALGNSTLISFSKYYYTVSSITVNAAVTANLTVGVNGLGGSQPYALDIYSSPVDASIVVDTATGSPTYKAQYTYDDIFAETWPNSTQHWFDSASMTGKTAAFVDTVSTPVAAVRIVITTQASSQSLSGRILQAGTIY